MILTNSGVLKLMQRIKSYIASQLNTKASSVHTHSISEIDDLSSLQMGGGYSKSEVDTLLNGKANSSHTHTKSQITDFPSIPSKTSELTNDSGFLTSHQDLSGYVPLAGTNALSGSIVPDTDNAYNFGDSTYGFASFYVNKIYLKGSTIFNLVDDNYICLGGATAQANGANLVLNGKNRSTSTGEFKLEARDGTNTKQLIGKPDGTLSWNGDIILSADDTYSLGSLIYNLKYVNTRRVRQNDLTDALLLIGAPRWNEGASIALFGKSNTTLGGGFRIDAHNGTVFKRLEGTPSGTLTWNGQSIQTTSDQRLKQQIDQIDDKLLDAWEDVTLCQFKYNDAVDQKGKDNARLHTGYVVQQIDKACKSHGVDVSAYGLYCHEEYPQETEEVEVEQADGTKTKERKVIREASEHYSLRYTETLVVECAYLRRENNRLKERLSKIEKLLNI